MNCANIRLHGATIKIDKLYLTVPENVTYFGLYDHFQAKCHDGQFSEFKLAET